MRAKLTDLQRDIKKTSSNSESKSPISIVIKINSKKNSPKELSMSSYLNHQPELTPRNRLSSGTLASYLAEDILRNEQNDKKRIKFIFGQETQQQNSYFQPSQFIPDRPAQVMMPQEQNLIKTPTASLKSPRSTKNSQNRVKFNDIIEVFDTDNLSTKPNYSTLSSKVVNSSSLNSRLSHKRLSTPVQSIIKLERQKENLENSNRNLRTPLIEFLFSENSFLPSKPAQVQRQPMNNSELNIQNLSTSPRLSDSTNLTNIKNMDQYFESQNLLDPNQSPSQSPPKFKTFTTVDSNINNNDLGNN